MSLPAGVTNPELARRGRSWEMAQRVKCLVHKSKDLSSDPLLTRVSARWTWKPVCNPRAGGAETPSPEPAGVLD